MRHAPILLILLVCLAASSPGRAQSTPASYTIAPRYAPGQALTLLIESGIRDARDGSAEQVYRAPVTLRVVRSGTSGTLLEWTAGKGSLESGAAASDPLVQMAERIITELGLIAQLDPAGRYLGLQNESSLRSRVEVFSKLLIPQATAKISDAAARQKAAAAMSAALSPEAMLSAARKEVDLYFGISGMQLEAGRVTRRKSGLLNPFSHSEALNGEMEIVAGTVDPATGELLVKFTQHYDPRQTLQMSAAKPDRASPGQQELYQLTLDDEGEFVVDAAKWQTRKVRHTRTIRRNKEAVRVESTVITVR